MTADRYKPVRFDVAAAGRRWSRDKAFRAAYDALADEFEALAELLRVRQQTGMTQAGVAEHMGVAQASVARLEACAGSRRHAPSLATLRKYADAVGCELRLSFAPKRKGREVSPAKAAAGTNSRRHAKR